MARLGDVRRDQRNPVLLDQLPRARRESMPDEHDPIDPAVEKNPDLLHLLSRIVFGVGDQKRVSVVAQPVLQAGDAVGEDRNPERRHHGADGAALARFQRPRRRIRRKAEQDDRALNLSLHGRSDDLRIVQDARHCRGRHAGGARHVRQFGSLPCALAHRFDLGCRLADRRCASNGACRIIDPKRSCASAFLDGGASPGNAAPLRDAAR